MQHFKEEKTLIVIGGGAAGFFCAVNAARLSGNLHVIILEKSSKVLAKVKISGGCRCNVTHHCFDVNELIKKYPRGKNFLKKELFQFTPQDTIDWFEERGVKLKTEPDGRMFPVSNSSQTIVDCLLQEATKYKVHLRMNSSVQKLFKDENKWIVDLGREKLQADFICVACGGFPKMQQFDWLQNLQHKIEPPVPSLFTFNIPDDSVTTLMGVGVQQVQVKVLGTKLKEEGPLMITHWGMSGPVVLRLSAWGARVLVEKDYHYKIHINWVPHFQEHTLREEWNFIRNKYAAQKMNDKNPFELPKRLWQYFLEKAEIPLAMFWSKLPSRQQNRLMQILVADEYEVKGKTTFKEEFVTCGGITLNEIDPQTIKSKLHENLFFAGEIMDVDGITGGFNFQHAWASGWIAAKNIAKDI